MNTMQLAILANLRVIYSAVPTIDDDKRPGDMIALDDLILSYVHGDLAKWVRADDKVDATIMVRRTRAKLVQRRSCPLRRPNRLARKGGAR